MSHADKPFWESLRLEEMNEAQWESLCDGCGRCCLHKLEDADTQEIFYTNVACRLFDAQTCRCTDYEHRSERVDDCVTLKPGTAKEFAWLPSSCAYRRLSEGRPLADWHPLVSGDPDSVRRAGISVRGRTFAEDIVSEDQIIEHIVTWVKR